MLSKAQKEKLKKEREKAKKKAAAQAKKASGPADERIDEPPAAAPASAEPEAASVEPEATASKSKSKKKKGAAGAASTAAPAPEPASTKASGKLAVLRAAMEEATLVLTVSDDGSGFPAAVLASLGRPYNSSKDRRGAGLGLFLATNVLRTLGGVLQARNRAGGGAETILRLPLASLALGAA